MVMHILNKACQYYYQALERYPKQIKKEELYYDG